MAVNGLRQGTNLFHGAIAQLAIPGVSFLTHTPPLTGEQSAAGLKKPGKDVWNGLLVSDNVPAYIQSVHFQC